MDFSVKQNRQMRSLGLALGVSIVAAVATMFVPVAALESITGASGLSELVPATAAPLGDTARALIAFGAGALTLAVMAALIVQQNGASPPSEIYPVEAQATEEAVEADFGTSFKARIIKLGLQKMPWVKGEDDITDLSDLPKLRGSDIHPDAPPRRPLSATQDLPALDLTEMDIEPVAEREAAVAATSILPIAAAPLNIQPTLAEMIAQLEASVAQREQQLAELEIVAASLAAQKSAETQVQVEVAVEAEPAVETVRAERRPLEAVPNSADQRDDMDEALTAALATLHRMNSTGR